MVCPSPAREAENQHHIADDATKVRISTNRLPGVSGHSIVVPEGGIERCVNRHVTDSRLIWLQREISGKGRNRSRYNASSACALDSSSSRVARLAAAPSTTLPGVFSRG